MESATVMLGERKISCVAQHYPWAHGCGVRIDLLDDGRSIGEVHVLCARDHTDFPALAALPPSALVSLALERLVAGQLAAKINDVVAAQDGIARVVSFRGAAA